MKIDDRASNLSFFFNNGRDPDYTVIGRVPAASGLALCASATVRMSTARC
jgi:hypothetical protein